MTNYEKIKSMSVEEMAKFINAKTYGCVMDIGCPCDCKEDNIPKSCADRIEQWLNSEVENNA